MANTLYVGTAEGSFATISDAVKAAADGDIIIVKGGEYTLTNETVSINKALTVKAEGDVTVDQFGIGSGTAKPQDIVIEGFTFKPTKCAVSSPARTCGIYQNGTNLTTLTVKDCTFDLTSPVAGTTGYGIHLDLNFSGTEKVTVDGCTFNGDGELVTSAMRASYQSSIEFTNNTVTDVSGMGVQLSLTGPTGGYNGEAQVVFDGNEFTNIGSNAIHAADIANDNTNFVVTDNTITNAQLNGGSQYWGAIRFGSGYVNGLTITGNTITNANVGIYQGVGLKDGATGTVEISENTMTLADRPVYGDASSTMTAGALNVYSNTDGTVSAGDTTGNTTIFAEPATSIIVDASIEGNAGDMIVIDGKAYVIGTNAFTTISAAAAAANAIDGKVTIEIAAGDYAEAKPVVLSKKTFTEDGKTYP
ncbi:MAG: right-handed parallel beta-helix repeat-containing protein, partial [Lentisphaeria bacterium]|nr:right-handed parallel beta-helix repeat-containing protein [Lentisphaeria bacterium]